MMRSHRLRKALLIAIGTGFFAVCDTQAQEGLSLQMTGQGRFTYFAALDTISPMAANLRQLDALQLSEPIEIGTETYIGGWSRWVFDCEARTAQRLDFSSLKADGTRGPATPTRGQAYPLVAGGDAAELAAVACGEVERRIDARTLQEAVKLSED